VQQRALGECVTEETATLENV